MKWQPGNKIYLFVKKKKTFKEIQSAGCNKTVHQKGHESVLNDATKQTQSWGKLELKRRYM